MRAAQELRAGRHHEHFVVDMIQGGAGTSTNMNANEVIANRALELMDKQRGDYAQVHPNNHVNLSQSTNDVYPTALKIALHNAIEALRAAMRDLVAAFLAKGEEFNPHLKMGRTQLQDAVPMTLGQEFTAFGHTILEDVDRLGEAQALIREINMGATAIGTGINAPSGYAAMVCRELSRIIGAQPHHGARSRRSDGGHGRVRAAVGCTEAMRREAVEDLQRSPAIELRPTRRLG